MDNSRTDNELSQLHLDYQEIYLRDGQECVGTLKGLEIGDQVAVVLSLAKGEYLKVIIDPSQADVLKKDLSELIGHKIGIMKTGILGRDFLVRKIQEGRKNCA